jgi:hypothetical protein
VPGNDVEDRALIEGCVFTGERYQDALLVEDGRVVSVGSREQVLRDKGTGSVIVHLRGRLVIPGLIDAHMHLGETTLLQEGVDLRAVRTIPEIRERTKAWMVRHPRGPVLGWGWDQENLEETRYPTRDDLEGISTDRPIILRRVCGHAAVLNSAALDALEIGSNPKDPPGGIYGRDAHGRLTGLLFDNALVALSPFSLDALKTNPERIRRTLDYAASTGLTTLVPVESAADEIRISMELANEEPLSARLRFYIDLRDLEEAPSFLKERGRDDWRLVGMKAETDGSLGAHTAWLFDGYADETTTGIPLWRDDELAEGLERSRELKLQAALHAIGDRATDRVLRLLETHPPSSRPRIEHASVTPPSLFARLDRVRPFLVVQPHFVVTDWWIPQRLGLERTRWTYAFKTLADRGYPLAGSSDSPVEPLDPWTGLEAAVKRAPGTEFGRRTAAERLSPEQALALYTKDCGDAVLDPRLGMLAPGSPADYLVLRTTSLQAAIQAGRKALTETWHDGRQTWSS